MSNSTKAVKGWRATALSAIALLLIVTLLYSFGVGYNTAPQELPDAYVRVLEQLGRYFEDNISLKRGADGRGTMTVRFTSDEQMQRFLDALENSAAE